MRFTRNEFDIMVNELLYTTPISYNMLCSIAEKTIRSSVAYWCCTDRYLRCSGYEDDIMQEIHLRLIQRTVSHFLLKNGINEPYNNDPEGFEDWMFTLAKNIKCDFSEKIRKRIFNTENLDDPIFENIPDDDTSDKYDNEERIERLKRALDVVLSSDLSVYKVLTWLAQFLFVLETGVTKIQSNVLILAAFEELTLYDMYNKLLMASRKIPWVVITNAQNDKILAALRKTRENGVSYGETKYKDFFMKHNGEISGKKSISDWANRMNDMVKRKTNENGAK